MILGRFLFMCVTALVFLLFLVLQKSSYRALCRAYTLVIAGIAFFAEPKYDLYNYIYGRMYHIAGMSLPRFMQSSSMQDTSEPIAELYFYILSKFPYRAFLMLTTVLIVYGLLFSLVFHVERKYTLRKTDLMILLIWVIGTTPYYTVLGGIRYQLAFTIFGYALYFDLVEQRQKKLCWIGYVAAVLIHNSSVVLLLIRIVLIFYKRRNSWLFTVAVFLGMIAIMPIINVLAGIVDSPFLTSILDKAEGYYGSGGSSLSVGNWTIAVMMALCGLIAYLVNRKYGIKKTEIAGVNGFLVLLLAFCIGSITTSDVFSRFGTAIKFAAIPLFAANLHEMQQHIAQMPQSQYIKHRPTQTDTEHIVLESVLLISAALYLGYQYFGKLTLLTLQWPPV